MGTGYTHGVEEGRITDLKEFVLVCANVSDMKTLPKSEVSYHTKALEDLNAELNKLQGLTPTEINRLQDAHIKTTERQNKEYSDNKKLYVKRFEAMLAKVRKWEPPTPGHTQLKQFMIEQLEDGIKENSEVFQWKIPPKVKPSQYIKEERTRLFKDIEYHTNELRDENEKRAKENSWIIELFKSLGLKPPKEE